MSELDKIEVYLKEKGISYERIDEDSSPKRLYGRHQIIVYNTKGKRQWDVVCHYGSYGYKEGLLEACGKPVVKPYDYDKVAGYLTAQDVINRLEGKDE